MSFFGPSNASTTTTSTLNTDVKDIEVPNPPEDSISRIAFCPAADVLAVSSWNGEIRLYDVSPANGQSSPKAMYKHDGPVLDLCWSKDGSKLFSASADKSAKAFDMTNGQSSQVAAHDAPISALRWVEAPTGGVLATASYDKSLRYWDLKSSTPVSTVALPERCYTMDVVYPLMVIGTAEKHICVINLSNPSTIFKTITSPLKWQTRVVACFPGGNGFAIGSIEGRVAIQYVEEKDTQLNFSFRCHRKDTSPTQKDTSLVYAVNAITFHPQHGTFATSGGDGTTSFWDGDSKTRLKSFEAAGGPVVCAQVSSSFDRSGTIFAYAIAYDWHKGYTGMVANHPNQIFLHACKDGEIKKRPKK